MPLPADPSPALKDYAHPERLVTADWLSAHLGTPGLAIVESEAAIVRLIFELASSGNGAGPMGVRAIAALLNERGDDLRGGRFHNSNANTGFNARGIGGRAGYSRNRSTAIDQKRHFTSVYAGFNPEMAIFGHGNTDLPSYFNRAANRFGLQALANRHEFAAE